MVFGAFGPSQNVYVNPGFFAKFGQNHGEIFQEVWRYENKNKISNFDQNLCWDSEDAGGLILS